MNDIKNIDFKTQLEKIRGLNKSSFLNNKDISSCKPGSFLEISDLTYRVEKINKYLDVKWKDFSKRRKDYWVYELTLFCLENSSIKMIEWEIDDDLELFETISSIKNHDIQYNNGKLNKNALEYMADEEEGVVSIKGKKYHYSEEYTWAALFYASDESIHNVRFYEFESSDGESLTVEAWTDDDYVEREAFLSKELKLSKLNILNI